VLESRLVKSGEGRAPKDDVSVVAVRYFNDNPFSGVLLTDLLRGVSVRNDSSSLCQERSGEPAPGEKR
jgi:hypothetical protein